MHAPTRTIAYLRVSTEQQADSGQSLDAQRAKIMLYAELHELDLVDVVVDAGASAKTLQRDGLQTALARIESGEADALLVAKLDRLTRSVKDLGELLEGTFGDGGADLLSVAEHIDTRTAAGRLVLNILASVSQWEREAIGERTKTAMAHMRTQGKRVGRIPFGYALDADGVHLVECEREQRALTAMVELRRDGLSCQKIADQLNAQGDLNRHGEWTYRAVHRLLGREARNGTSALAVAA